MQWIGWSGKPFERSWSREVSRQINAGVRDAATNCKQPSGPFGAYARDRHEPTPISRAPETDLNRRRPEPSTPISQNPRAVSAAIARALTVLSIASVSPSPRIIFSHRYLNVFGAQSSSEESLSHDNAYYKRTFGLAVARSRQWFSHRAPRKVAPSSPTGSLATAGYNVRGQIDHNLLADLASARADSVKIFKFDVSSKSPRTYEPILSRAPTKSGSESKENRQLVARSSLCSRPCPPVRVLAEEFGDASDDKRRGVPSDSTRQNTEYWMPLQQTFGAADPSANWQRRTHLTPNGSAGRTDTSIGCCIMTSSAITKPKTTVKKSIVNAVM